MGRSHQRGGSQELNSCTYYRSFVQDFVSLAAPLSWLTRKGMHFSWDEECQAAFDDLRMALVEATVLPYLYQKFPYLLYINASAEGVGAVLAQVKDGRGHIVAYYDAKFSRPERNYWVTRKELLAVVKSRALPPVPICRRVHHPDRPLCPAVVEDTEGAEGTSGDVVGTPRALQLPHCPPPGPCPLQR